MISNNFNKHKIVICYIKYKNNNVKSEKFSHPAANILAFNEKLYFIIVIPEKVVFH